jgi:hypothetical protein
MKHFITLAFTALLIAAPLKQAHALDMTGASVAGIVVSSFSGPMAGSGSSSITVAGILLYRGGSAVNELMNLNNILRLRKEAALREAQNDIQIFDATKVISIPLKASIKGVMDKDENLSKKEAMDLIANSISEELAAMDAENLEQAE